MTSRIHPYLALGLVVAACDSVVGYDYRVASKDQKVTSAQMLRVVTRSIDRPESSDSARVSAWAKVDEKTGEVVFALGAFGSGKTPSIRSAETRLLRDLRYEFGDRVEVFVNGERLNWDGTVERQAAPAATPPAQEGVGLGP